MKIVPVKEKNSTRQNTKVQTESKDKKEKSISLP
jgi:hypothetical protein